MELIGGFVKMFCEKVSSEVNPHIYINAIGYNMIIIIKVTQR